MTLIPLKQMTRWALGAMLGAAAFAAPAAAADEWSGWASLNLARVQAHQGGIIFYLDATPPSTASGCPLKFFVPISTANYDFFAGLVLTAYARGDELNIYFDTADSQCNTPVGAMEARIEP